MSVRLCKKCHENCIVHGLLDAVMTLAKKGAWICPFGKSDCGKVKG